MKSETLNLFLQLWSVNEVFNKDKLAWRNCVYTIQIWYDITLLLLFVMLKIIWIIELRSRNNIGNFIIEKL